MLPAAEVSPAVEIDKDRRGGRRGSAVVHIEQVASAGRTIGLVANSDHLSGTGWVWSQHRPQRVAEGGSFWPGVGSAG